MTRPDYEAAARAAGYEIRFHYGTCKGGEYEGCEILRGGEWVAWRPLDDDGDAFRLAVALGSKYPAAVIGIFNRAAFPHASASVVHRDGTESYVDYVEQDAGDDLSAATRRAIFRAAVAAGGEAT